MTWPYGAQEKFSLHQDRCYLESHFVIEIGFDIERSGSEGPCNLQLGDVGAVDLGDR